MPCLAGGETRSVAILIDGYNLLHGTDLFGSGRAAGTLEASREALLQFVIEALEPGELSETTIVFDSKEAPPGLPRVLHREGLTIRYASDYANADELLEELIQADTSPRKLLVVSSDHQVQRAARRRKARFVESRQWYVEMRQRLLASAKQKKEARPVEMLSAAEIEEWERDAAAIQAEEASREAINMSDAKRQASGQSSDVQVPAPKKKEPTQRRIRVKRRRKTSEDSAKEIDLANPFPPGYGEDLLAGEEDD
jgi:predicted RNA-binding protein with PIN domain